MHIFFPFARYTLSDETKQSLKTPGFDVWQWEPNEVEISLLFFLNLHFFLLFRCWRFWRRCTMNWDWQVMQTKTNTQLKIKRINSLFKVEELEIHPSTLKRFLLRVQENYRLKYSYIGWKRIIGWKQIKVHRLDNFDHRNNPFHNFRHSFCVTQMM